MVNRVPHPPQSQRPPRPVHPMPHPDPADRVGQLTDLPEQLLGRPHPTHCRRELPRRQHGIERCEDPHRAHKLRRGHGPGAGVREPDHRIRSASRRGDGLDAYRLSGLHDDCLMPRIPEPDSERHYRPYIPGRPSDRHPHRSGATWSRAFSSTSVRAGWIQYWPRAIVRASSPVAIAWMAGWMSVDACGPRMWQPSSCRLSGSTSTLATCTPVSSSAHPYATSAYRSTPTRYGVWAARSSRSVTPMPASCGSVNTAYGIARWFADTRSSGCSRLCATTRASAFAACLSIDGFDTSPSAKMPSAVVRW